jgi:hypothetical protein
MINKNKEIKAVRENKTSKNVRRSFTHTNILDERGLRKLQRTKLRMANPVIIFFVSISEIGFYYD